MQPPPEPAVEEHSGSTLAASPVQVVLPSIADGVERSLDPRLVALDRTVGWIVTGVMASASLVGLGIFTVSSVLTGVLPIWAAPLLAIAWAASISFLAWFLHRWPEIAHRYARYRVDDNGIEIRRGVYWRRVTNVPRSRVQHTDVSQGPLERGWGLGTVVIYTAGTDYAKVELRGLDHATAIRIRDHLLPREGTDGV